MSILGFKNVKKLTLNAGLHLEEEVYDRYHGHYADARYEQEEVVSEEVEDKGEKIGQLGALHGVHAIRCTRWYINA